MVSVERCLFFSVVLVMAFQQVTAQGAWASWQEWSAWSECDRTCDTGNQMRSRIRDCEGDPAACIGAFNDSESRECNEQACPGCDSNPCLNDGFCMDGSDGMFTCVCSPSYTGDFCQTEVCPVGQEFQACGSTCPASCQPQPGDCPDTCIMGCFCIEGTVLDDNGNCIPPEDCPCILDDGSLLENGEEVALYSEQECSRCTCIEGNLTCVVKTPCSHTCTVAGDPHYETFDGRRYNFMGNCSYVLAEDAVYGDFSVSADNRKCRRGRRTCLNQVIIHIPSELTTVTMNRDLEVFENGTEVALPYELTGLVLLLRVEAIAPTALIATLYDPGMTVVWDGRSVEIYNQFHWLTYGLCGTFDVNPDNDFRMRDGSIEPDVNIFAEDWEDLWCRGNDGGV